MTTPTDSPIPDETTLRKAGDDELTQIAGLPDGSLARAMTTFNRLVAVDSAAQRRRLLENLAARSASTDLGPVAGALARRRSPLEDVTGLLDVDGVGPRRFVATVRVLAGADLDDADLDLRVADTREALGAAVPDDPAVDRLFRLVLAGRDATVFADDTPGLDVVRRAVAEPAKVDGGDIDAVELRRSLAQLAAFTTFDVLTLAGFDGTVVLDPPVTTTDDGDDGGGTGDDDPFPKAPASPWDEGFLAGEKLKQTVDCPQVKVVPPAARPGGIQLGTIGNTEKMAAAVVGLSRALGNLYLALEAAAIDALVPDPIPGMGDALPRAIEVLLRTVIFDPIRRRFPEGFLPQSPQVESDQAGVLRALNAVQTAVAQVGAVQLLPQPATVAKPRLTRSTLDIEGPPGAAVILSGFSRMLSTYSFGTGKGTYSTGGRSDRPWFALVAKPAVKGPMGDFPAAVLQLGERGADTDTDRESLVIPDTGKLSLPIRINGNYGQLRVVVDPPGAPVCPGVVADLFTVSGPYEGPARRQEEIRSMATVRAIARLRDTADDLADAIDFGQSFISAVAGFGAAVGVLADAVEKALKRLLGWLIDQYEEANAAQRALNTAAIESLPERTPPGSPEPA